MINGALANRPISTLISIDLRPLSQLPPCAGLNLEASVAPLEYELGGETEPIGQWKPRFNSQHVQGRGPAVRVRAVGVAHADRNRAMRDRATGA